MKSQHVTEQVIAAVKY